MMFNYRILQNLMAKAYHLALESPDPSSQNGAILVRRQINGNLDVVANGYNHFYKGIPEIVDNREKKLNGIEHAERDCIYSAAREGIPTKGSIMICPWAACFGCARSIIGAGCDALIYHRQRYLRTDSRWADDIDESLNWIQKAGIWIYEFDGPCPQTKPILISGRLWSPETCEYV